MDAVSLYVACSQSGTIDHLRLGPDGSLNPAGRTEEVPMVKALALDPGAGLLYAGLNAEPTAVAVFELGEDGTPARHSTSGLGAPTAYLAVHPERQWLLNASYHSNTLEAIPLHRDGAVDGGARLLEPGRKVHSAVPSPDGRFVYSAALGSDRVVWYRYDGGSFGEAGSVDSPEGSGPRHLRFSADGSTVYVLHEMTGTVTVYRRDARTGALAEIQSVAAVPESLGLAPGWARGNGRPDPDLGHIWCADLRLGLEGRYLYATERSSSTVSVLAVAPQDGRLEYLHSVQTERQPRGAAVDPSGRFLLVAGEKSHHVSSYRLGEDGSVEPVDRVATGHGPMWIEVRG